MRTKRWMATCVVALLSVAAVMAKDIRVVVFKVTQMHCENCEKKVKDNMRFEKGLKDVSTVVKDRTVTITYDAEKIIAIAQEESGIFIAKKKVLHYRLLNIIP